ncbi:MAG: GyrI-like domain-containing protein [Acidobacteriota bacterium]|nr:GyrI-like domain-containing protein [Acidobacteriota bacterium]
MNDELAELPGLTVMGLHTRASNRELNRIGDLWRSFHAQGDHVIIPARVDDAHICVYCEYEGDHTQPYTIVIGCEVPPGTPTLDGMKTVRVEPGRFAVYRRAYARPNPVFVTWEEIWKTPLDRRYQADYDRYGSDGISVNVGIR